MFCQTNYKKIFKKLSTSRKSVEDSREAIIYMCGLLKKCKVKDFKDFILDEKMLLPTNLNTSMENVDVQIQTDGLISQILENIGDKEHKSRVLEIQKLIFELQSPYHNKNLLDSYRNALKELLNEILLIAE